MLTELGMHLLGVNLFALKYQIFYLLLSVLQDTAVSLFLPWVASVYQDSSSIFSKLK